MRQFWTRVIEILDGSPAAHAPSKDEKRQRRQRGQSLVEMAFLTPVLIILFAGLVEIGWLANNYLNILDVTRYGARRATTLTDTRSPLFWDDRSSYVPNANIRVQYQMPYIDAAAALIENQQRVNVRDEYLGGILSAEPADVVAARTTSPCGGADQTLIGFYNDVACTMLSSMTPLFMNPYNGVDDIIVSAFALELIDVTKDDEGGGIDRWTSLPAPLMRPIAANVPQLLVVGRYPVNANECQASETFVSDPDIFDARDPFDFNGNGFIDAFTGNIPSGPTAALYNVSDEFEELPGFDVGGTTAAGFVDFGIDPDDPSDDNYTQGTIEKQVGFMWFGNHIIGGTGCIGSEFRIAQIEELFNLAEYTVDSLDPDTNVYEERRLLPSQGVALVEMYWEHEMLLKIPVLSPVFEAFSRDGRPDLYLWAMFPLPSVEPYIELIDKPGAD